MPDLRSDMAVLFADLQKIPEGLGFRERAVVLRTYTVTGANPARQLPGVRTPEDTPITPTPKVSDSGFALIQMQKAHGGTIEEGDALVTAIPRSYTEAQLRDSEWRIDGEAFRLIRLVQKPTSWQAFVRRSKA